MKFYSLVVVAVTCIVLSSCGTQFSTSGTSISRSSLIAATSQNMDTRQPIHSKTNSSVLNSMPVNNITGISSAPAPYLQKITCPASSKPNISLTKNAEKAIAQNNSPKATTGITGSVPPWPDYEPDAIAASIAFGISLFFLTVSLLEVVLIPVGLLAAFIAMLTGFSAIKKLKHEPTFHGRFLAWLGFLGGILILAGAISFIGYILATAKH